MSGLRYLLTAMVVAGCALAQTAPDDMPKDTRPPKVKQQKARQSPGREAAGGAGNIAGGAAKGAGHAVAGVGNGAVDLVTLHPINAGVDVGRGAASAGKDVGVGTIKGTARMTHALGRGLRHIF
ncbi:MAG TPA: hypothetical protein VFA04_09745 [Bryobacteraceae bacterium]|nr:hypothetical protein [Bryobacteraceae bacterium]